MAKRKVGRPKLKKADKRMPLTVTLPKESREALEAWMKEEGHKSLSAAVEALIDTIE